MQAVQALRCRVGQIARQTLAFVKKVRGHVQGVLVVKAALVFRVQHRAGGRSKGFQSRHIAAKVFAEKSSNQVPGARLRERPRRDVPRKLCPFEHVVGKPQGTHVPSGDVPIERRQLEHANGATHVARVPPRNIAVEGRTMKKDVHVFDARDVDVVQIACRAVGFDALRNEAAQMRVAGSNNGDGLIEHASIVPNHRATRARGRWRHVQCARGCPSRLARDRVGPDPSHGPRDEPAPLLLPSRGPRAIRRFG